jgi:hypothetical protein
MTSRVRSDSAWIGIALIALAFAAGAGSGVATERLVAHRSAGNTRVVQDMSEVLDQLGLTGEQRRQAQAILDREAPRSQRAMLQLAAQLRAVSDSVDAELRVVLTPAQRVKLDSLRHPPTFILKHQDSTGMSTVDTVYPPPAR